MGVLKRICDALVVLSAFFSFLVSAIFLKIMLPLGAFERTSPANYVSFYKKEIIFGIIFYAVWTFLYYYLVQEYIPKVLAYLSSVLFLALAYCSMLYRVNEVHYFKEIIFGAVCTLILLAIAAGFFPKVLNRFTHLVFTDFLGIKKLKGKFRIILLIVMPLGIFSFFAFVPMVIKEGFQVVGIFN